jgi:hypothetical protein
MSDPTLYEIVTIDQLETRVAAHAAHAMVG